MAGILDFYDIIVNQIVGDPGLFIILTFLIVGLILVLSRAPNIVFMFFMTALTGVLAIEFPILRWILAILGGGFIGWTFMRIRRE